MSGLPQFPGPLVIETMAEATVTAPAGDCSREQPASVSTP